MIRSREQAKPKAREAGKGAARLPLKDAPEQINEDSYGEGWLVKVKLSDPGELDDLLDAESYRSSLS